MHYRVPGRAAQPIMLLAMILSLDRPIHHWASPSCEDQHRQLNTNIDPRCQSFTARRGPVVNGAFCESGIYVKERVERPSHATNTNNLSIVMSGGIYLLY